MISKKILEVTETPHLSSVKIIWKNLFIQIGPALLYQCSEAELQKRLSVLIARMSLKKLLASPHLYDAEIKDFRITDNSFEIILMQFRKWGLMEISYMSDKKTTYWRLTEYGKVLLEELLAVL